jgi:hypothetical protein
MKPRRGNRHKVLIRARLRGENGAREACILDLSARGLLVTASDAPPRGAFVELVAQADQGLHVLVGQVEWSSGRRFGLTLYESLDLSVWVGLSAPAVAPAPVVRRHDAARDLGRGIEFWVIVALAMLGALWVAHIAAGQFTWAQTVRQTLEKANAR